MKSAHSSASSSSGVSGNPATTTAVRLQNQQKPTKPTVFTCVRYSESTCWSESKQSAGHPGHPEGSDGSSRDKLRWRKLKLYHCSLYTFAYRYYSHTAPTPILSHLHVGGEKITMIFWAASWKVHS